MERKQITFYRSFYEAIRRLRRKADRCDAYDALLAYAFFEVMPDLEELEPQVAALFELIKPTLDTGRRKAEKAMKRNKQTESKPERSGKETGN